MRNKHNLPKNINVLIDRVIDLLSPEKILLFGSQAKNDAKFYSDYDIAVIAKDDQPAKWSQLFWELEEGTLTLLPVDIVNWNHSSNELQKRIINEGIVLYDQSANIL